MVTLSSTRCLHTDCTYRSGLSRSGMTIMITKKLHKDSDPSKESVWDYPRPPLLEPTARHLKVVFAGKVIAETERGFRVLETSHPPVYYFPTEDIRMEFLHPSDWSSFCEWKGSAEYYNLKVG